MKPRRALSDQAESRFRHGLAMRAAQRTEEAREAIAEAARLAPDDPALALANARIHFETWRPATALFERALALDRGNPDTLAALALTLSAERQGDRADALLARAVADCPGWIAGHRQLAQQRITSGATHGCDRSFAAACDALPDDVALRLAWFHTLVSVRDWPAARRVVADGIARFGAIRAFELARVFLASESDEMSRDPHLFDGLADVNDIGLDLARTRFHLRCGRPEIAATIAERQIVGPAARNFWPYLSLAWRLLGDGRSTWLDGDVAFVSTADLELSRQDLDALGQTVRSLMTMAAPFPEQSVRGGVQTGRHLFFHPDPAIQSVRRRAIEAVGAYVDALPPRDAAHPLLTPARGDVLFEGSWAVILDPGGHHAAHTHSRGWISSALHIELADPGDDRSEGHIAFGTAPAELGLDLSPTRAIAPRPGTLVLFPSTTWHRTEPFTQGQRLTVAFDVKPLP